MNSLKTNALKKLHPASQRIPMHASPATAHMFIVSPLTGGGLMKLFSTHPTYGREDCKTGVNEARLITSEVKSANKTISVKRRLS